MNKNKTKIIVINNHTKQSYFTACYSEVGKMIGISPDTVSRWEKIKIENGHRMYEHFNHFTIYFQAEQLKSEKGYASK